MSAYVYLIEEVSFQGDTSGPWTKIGYSKNPPEWRMNANLKRGNPRDLKVFAAYEYESVGEARKAEKDAHLRFADKSGKKEWFNLSAEEISEWFDTLGAKKRGW